MTRVQFPTILTEFQEKKAQSLDKCTLFLGINTNFLTSTGASRHLILETYFSAIFLAFTPLFSLLSAATHYIYPHSFSTFITPLLILSSESIWQVPHRCHPSFISYHVVSQHIFLRKYQEHHSSIKRFLGFSSILECVAHPLVIKRNFTPTLKFGMLPKLVTLHMHVYGRGPI